MNGLMMFFTVPFFIMVNQPVQISAIDPTIPVPAVSENLLNNPRIAAILQAPEPVSNQTQSTIQNAVLLPPESSGQ